MKTLIVGTGVIGTLYGWALAEAGVDVTHFVRPGKAAGLTGPVPMDVLDERAGHEKYTKSTYNRRCVEAITPADGYELILVPTTAQQTESALQTLVPQAGEKALFLIFAANWEGTAFIDRLLPRSRYLMGYADGGGTIRDGLYWTNLGAEIHLGAVDGAAADALARVAALFERADMKPDLPANIVHWLWLHNAFAVGFWAGFAKYRDKEALLNDRALVKQCYVATKELIALCQRRGVDTGGDPQSVFFKMPFWLFVILFRRLWRTNESMQRFTAHANDSLPEAKVLYAQIMATARELGCPMPTLEALGQYLAAV